MARKKPKYKQGIFKPKFPEKYTKGDPTKIVFRSGLELKYFHHLDTRKNVLEWASEEFFIPYVGPDGKRHRYFVDIWAKVKMKDGNIQEFIAEIKPFEQTKMPKPQKRMTQAYRRRVSTWMVNKSKWDAAENFALKNGQKFVLLTEKDIK